jgi:hypothetical protein
MTFTVSAAGLMEPRHRYAWTAGCRTPDSIRMPLDGVLKAAGKEELLLGLSSLSRISRNSRKLMRVLEFLLAHRARILTTNYLITYKEMWVRRHELVQHRHPQAADQRQRDGQPLLLAAGELSARSRRGSSPSTLIWPRSGSRSPSMHSTAVVLLVPLRVLCCLNRGNRQPCHPVGDRRVATARPTGKRTDGRQPGRGIARSIGQLA